MLWWSIVVKDTKKYADKGWDSLQQIYSRKNAHYMWFWMATSKKQTQWYCSILKMNVRQSWKFSKISLNFSFCFKLTKLSFSLRKKFVNRQDHMICIAHYLAELTYKNQFYQDLHWSFVNWFSRLYHYTQQQALTQDAFKAVYAAKRLSIFLIKMSLEK